MLHPFILKEDINEINIYHIMQLQLHRGELTYQSFSSSSNIQSKDG